MINFNHLRAFFHVANELSFTSAGRELGVSQPAVTAQVKALEHSWNMKLLDRKGAQIYLTEEGKALFEYTKRCFEFEREVEVAVENIRKLRQGVLRVGTPRVFGAFTALVLDSFHRGYPDITIQINEGTSLSLMHRVLNSETEVAIIAKLEDHPSVCFTHFIRERLGCIVGPNHHLARKGSVSFEELSEESIILREKGSGTRKVVIEQFENRGYTPKVLLETGNFELIKQLVEQGEGVSFMNLGAVNDEINQGKLVNLSISDCVIFLDLHLAYLKDRSLSLPAREFLKVLARAIPGSLRFPYVVTSWAKNCPFLSGS